MLSENGVILQTRGKVRRLKIKETELPGVLIFEPKVHVDPRGFFCETYRVDTYSAAGLPVFVQHNQSRSTRGTLRGLHYQLDRPQGKLISVIRGSVFDVAVDIRKGSPAFGRWTSFVLSEDDKRQAYIPPGFAHGFCVTSEAAEVAYLCSDYYSGVADQRGVLWSDAGLAIPWPVTDPMLSDKDRAFLPLLPQRSDLPIYGR